MTGFLIKRAQEEGSLVFAVPGSPLVGEAVVRSLREQARSGGISLQIFSAPGFLESLYQLLGIDPCEGLIITDSFQFCDLEGETPYLFAPGRTGLVIMQLYSRTIASEVKLTLMDYYPDVHQVLLVQSAGVRGSEKVIKIPLYELDRQDTDHLTTLYVPPFAGEPAMEESEESAAVYETGICLDPLVDVMDRLLSPDGCPWDRQQTHQTLKKYLIEETYEVLDAIDEGNMHKLCEELGDLLLQIVFNAALAERSGNFNITQVISGITEKMIHRHPHVFGETTVDSAAEVMKNWEEIKQDEGEPKSMLAGVPRYLPALQRSQKVQAKAALVGFDWPEAEGAALKVEEEWQEVKDAWDNDERDELQKELGDFLFAAVNTCRLLRFDAEETLRTAVDKFTKRFCSMEKKAREQGLKLGGLSLSQMDVLWEKVKSEEIQ